MVDELEQDESPEEELSEDYEIEENEDGSAQLIPKETPELAELDFYDNLAETLLDPLELNNLATDYLDYIELDKKAREEREKQYAETIRRTGLGNDAPGGAEFDGASKVVHPLISEAVVDFASAAIKELFPATGPVKIKIQGKQDSEKYRKADRKQRHMNWQCTTQMPEFKSVIEQVLTQIPLGGVQYTKMYFWDRGNRPKTEFVPLDDIYIPYQAANFLSSERKTHRQRLTKMEFEERIAAGIYIDPELSITAGADPDSDSAPQRATNKIEGKSQEGYDEDGMRTVFEIFCWLNIEDQEVSGEYSYAPYILIIDEPSSKVLGLYRNWDPEDATRQELQWIVEWPFIPWRGAMAIGLGHLIGSLSAAATGALRALLDSAHINNAATGLKLKGGQMSGQTASISIGNIHEIDAAPNVDDIRKIFMPLPFNPPSTVLFELLGFITAAAKGIVKTAIEQNPDYSPNTPPGTEYSHIEQGMKVYSAIHSRLHDAMSRQLDILHRLNRLHLEDSHPPESEEEEDSFSDMENNCLAFKSDYEGEMDVQPVSDPNIFAEAQRFAQMASIERLIDKAPQIYNVRAYHERMLQLMKVPDYEQLLPKPQGEQDENPATENIKMASGATANVLPDQDHLAHIQTHMDFMLSPLFGQNPVIKKNYAPQWLAHMIQHMLMLYGSEVKDLIEQAAGMEAKDFASDNPKVTEALAKAIAAASPLAIKNVTPLLEKLLPTIVETMQFVQQNSPPPPVDPSVATMQVAQMNLQQKKEEIAQNAQLKQLEIQTDASSKQQDNQARLQEQQLENASDKEVAEIKAMTELKKNTDDNNTAKELTALKILASGGKEAGGFTNGNSLDNPQ